MKNNKKILITIISIVGAILIAFGIYTIFFKEDKNTTLTLIEKQWIENNKNKVIDFSIINQIPIISDNGEGLFFDFLAAFEKDTKLSFNKVAYNSETGNKSNYSFKIVDTVGANDIEVYEDNYVLVTRSGQIYSHIDELKGMTIGVLNTKLDAVNTYLNVNSNFLFKSYDDYFQMVEDLKTIENQENKLDGIVIPRTAYLETILENPDFIISYNISQIKEYYVISLGDMDRLNDIIKKYYKKWYKESYQKSYEEQFLNSYFELAGIGDKERVEFKSKRYVYGFIDNKPYDTLYEGEFLGINHQLLASFAELASIEMDYKRFNTIDALIKDFNANNLDLFFNNTSNYSFQMDTTNTVSLYDEKLVVLSNPVTDHQIDSFVSLKGKEVYALKSSAIENTLNGTGAETKAFKDMKSLLSNINEDSILVLDLETYNYYSAKELKDYKINYIYQLPIEYSFTIRNISDNQVFIKLFNFYLSFFSNSNTYNEGYQEVLFIRDVKMSARTIILSIIGIIFAGICVFFGIKLTRPKKKEKKKINLSKDDKIKYIDMLTSLKNRNYLNDNIEKWDNAGIYPQTVVIIDLNNVAYINDNYGHSEGDKLIGEAANILINTQLPNTEIIRTNGNEFLVYMVGYEEKQVVSYIKKLNKEFKTLNHGFGAAMGYSMITDAIKTVDDAINEATTDMKENKEELDY